MAHLRPETFRYRQGVLAKYARALAIKYAGDELLMRDHVVQATEVGPAQARLYLRQAMTSEHLKGAIPYADNFTFIELDLEQLFVELNLSPTARPRTRKNGTAAGGALLPKQAALPLPAPAAKADTGEPAPQETVGDLAIIKALVGKLALAELVDLSDHVTFVLARKYEERNG